MTMKHCRGNVRGTKYSGNKNRVLEWNMNASVIKSK